MVFSEHSSGKALHPVLICSAVSPEAKREMWRSCFCLFLFCLTSTYLSSFVCPAALGSSPAGNRSESPSVQACLNRAGSGPHSWRRPGVNGRGSGSRPPSLSKPQGEAVTNTLPLTSHVCLLFSHMSKVSSHVADCPSGVTAPSLSLSPASLSGTQLFSIFCFYNIGEYSRGNSDTAGSCIRNLFCKKLWLTVVQTTGGYDPAH